MHALKEFLVSPLVNIFMLPIILICIGVGEYLDRKEYGR